MSGSKDAPKVANPERSRAMHGLRSSGAAGFHGDRRTKRRRDRGAQRRAAIREQFD